MTQENKFTVGSQWVTRNGQRAVIVDIKNLEMIVWHEGDESGDKITSIFDGRLSLLSESAYDLIAPWVEKRTGTVWVNVCVFESGEIMSFTYNTQQNADIAKRSMNSGYKFLTQFSYDWKED